MKIRITISLVVLMLGICTIAQAQEGSKKSKFQVSFGYPVGTHGMQKDYVNDFSFNILYGLNGGVDGFEYGGVFNYNSGDVKGFQMAGVANINRGNTQGFQLSGALNIKILIQKGFSYLLPI